MIDQLCEDAECLLEAAQRCWTEYNTTVNIDDEAPELDLDDLGKVVDMAADLKRKLDELSLINRYSDVTYRRPIITIDFDGVITKHKMPWIQDRIIDEREEVTPGIIEWMLKASEDHKLIVLSKRCNSYWGIWAMKGFMLKKGFPSELIHHLTFAPGKPSAHMMVDDRAVQFDGDVNHLPNPKEFKPWWK